MFLKKKRERTPLFVKAFFESKSLRLPGAWATSAAASRSTGQRTGLGARGGGGGSAEKEKGLGLRGFRV